MRNQKYMLFITLISLWGAVSLVSAGKIEGVLITNTSRNPRILLTGRNCTPQVGDRGELSKYFERTFMSGWLGKGEVEVTKFRGDTLHIKVVKEEGIINLNGAPVNHFTRGTKVIIQFPDLPEDESYGNYRADDYSADDYSADDYSADDYSADDYSDDDYSADDYSDDDYSDDSLENVVAETKPIEKKEPPKPTISSYTYQWKKKLEEHITHVAYTPNGLIVSATSEGVLRLHNPETGEVVESDTIPPLVPGGLRVIDSTRLLMVCAIKNSLPPNVCASDTEVLRYLLQPNSTMILTVKLPDLTMRKMHTFAHIYPQAAAIGTSHIAAAGENGNVTVWTLDSTTIVDSLDMSTHLMGDIRGLAFSPDEQWIAISASVIKDGKESVLLLYNRSSSKVSLLEKSALSYRGLSFSPDNLKLLASNSRDSASIYSVADAVLSHAVWVPDSINESYWISDSSFITSSSSGVYLHSSTSGELQMINKAYKTPVIDVLYSGAYLALGSKEGVVLHLKDSKKEGLLVTGSKRKPRKKGYHPPEKYGMKRIKGGRFFMGSFKGNSDERDPRFVTVDSFYMDTTELTQREFERLMGFNPSKIKADDHPIENVTWWSAIRYCNARSREEGLPEVYDELTGDADFSVCGYRLPTEAEWEYAARGGEFEEYFWGKKVNKAYKYANFADVNSSNTWRDSLQNDKVGDSTAPVASYKPNKFGLYDMAGNVWEWCNDWYSKTCYNDTKFDVSNPQGPQTGNYCVERGGGYGSSLSSLRSARRRKFKRNRGSGDLGFRVVLPMQ